MPNGPEDLDESMRSITLAISPGPVAVRKKEHPFGFINNFPLPISPLSFLSAYLDSPCNFPQHEEFYLGLLPQELRNDH